MGRQISVDQGTGGVDYPLVRPDRQLGKLVADLCLVYREDLCEFVAPLRITRLSGFGSGTAETAVGPNDKDITIVDAENTVVFNSDAADFTESAWGTDKVVVEWAFEATGEVCRIVAYTDDLAAWPAAFVPTNAVINPRATQKRGSALDKLIVETADGDYTIEGDGIVELSEGYNIELAATVDTAADGAERSSTVTVSCVPGSGLGRYPGCDPTPVLRRFANVTPRETGDISLVAQQCFRAELVPTASDADSVTVVPSTIRIATSCGPCAKCEQFAAVYESYRRLHLKYKALGRRGEAVRDQRKSNITRWNTSINCRKDTSLRLLAIPIGACRLVIGGALCNNTDGPVRSANLRFTFDGEVAVSCLLCRTIWRRGNRDVATKIPPNQWMPYNLTVNDGGYEGGFDCIDPGGQGVIAFQTFFNDAVHGQAVTVTLEALDYDVPPVSMDVNLNCSKTYDPSCCEALRSTTSTAP